MLPKVKAWVGQAAWQAVLTSLAPIGRLSASASIRAAAMRCRQNVHFSITPRARTVTSGIAGDGRTVFLLGKGKVVEAAHLVGTVVGAEPRADAAVVDHDVQALLVVHRGADGTDDLARRLLAVLAQHGLEQHVRGLRAGPRSSGRCASQCISRSWMHLRLPTVGMLFSAMQATTQALQPMQAFRSMLMPQAAGPVGLRFV